MTRASPTPCTIDGVLGWWLPSPMLPSGAESKVVAVDPNGISRLVERKRITVVAAG